LLETYCKYIGIDYNDYKKYFQSGEPNESLRKNETWQEYEKAFYARTDIKNHQKKSFFKNLKPEEQQKDLDNLLYRHIREIEKEKLYYFLLAQSNAMPVLIIKSPSDNKAMKKFLGYEWSAAKGSEGIKYLNAASGPAKENEDEPTLVTAMLNSIQTPLYNPAEPGDENKLNYYIHENFLGKTIKLPENLKEFAHTSQLVEMLDFSRKDFNKAFSLTGRKVVEIASKWELKTLGQIADISKGKSITEKDTKPGNIKVVAGGTDFAYFHNESNRESNIITISASGANAGFVNYWTEEIFASDCTTVFTTDKSFTYYLFIYLKSIQEQIFSLARGAAQPHVYPDDIGSLKVPVPPPDVRQNIVKECKEIDDAVNEAQQDIQQLKAEIESKVENTFNKNYPLRNLNNIAITNPSKTELKDFDDNMHVSFIEMASVSNDGFIEKMEDRLLKDVRKGSYTYFAEGDIIIAKITPCMENGKCALAKDLINGIALGSSEFHVIRTNEKIDASYLFYHLNRSKIRIEAEKRMTGSSGHRRVPISFYENLQIPVPSLTVQQKLAKEIEILEAQIATSQNVIDNAAAKKQGILTKWLE